MNHSQWWEENWTYIYFKSIQQQQALEARKLGDRNPQPLRYTHMHMEHFSGYLYMSHKSMSLGN